MDCPYDVDWCDRDRHWCGECSADVVDAVYEQHRDRLMEDTDND